MVGVDEAAWTAADIEIIFDDYMSEGAYVTARVRTPIDTLVLLARIERFDDELVLAEVHIHGENFGANALGPARLRQVASAVAEKVEVDAITIRGAVRTSGATVGRLPGPLRFARKISP